MATESFEVSRIIPATPERIFNAWLDGAEHAKFTGMAATIDRTVGGSFTIGDGYIQGSTLEMEPHRRIVQSWRTTEFPEGASPSRLEVFLEPAEGGTRVRIVHSEIPQGQSERYLKGWGQFYFDPMTEYFSESIGQDTASEDISDDEVTPGVDDPTADQEPASEPQVGDDEPTPVPTPARKKPARKAPAKKAARKAPAKKAAAKAKPKAAAKKKAAKPAAKAAKAKGKAGSAKKAGKAKKPAKKAVARRR